VSDVGNGQMKWFGPSWGAPICEPVDEASSPVGEDCLLCHEPIREGQRGVLLVFSDEKGSRYVPEHIDCFCRSLGIASGVARSPN
jgi:hypothetical protein